MLSTILYRNVNALSDAFDKLNLKAEKYGTEPLSFKVVSEPYKFKKTDPEFYVNVEVSGAIPKVGNFKLICVLEYLSDGQNILRVVPGETVPEQYRNTSFYCDHCKTNRYRKEVVVVQNTDTGEYVQLGKNCLKDYLGVNLEHMVNRFSWVNELIENFSDPDFTYGGKITYSCNKRLFLKCCSKVIRELGFRSRKVAYDEGGLTTSYITGEVVFGTRDRIVIELIRRHDLTEYSSDDEALVEKALEWIANVNDSGNDYYYNLKAILSSDEISEKHFGFVASLIPAYNKAMEKELVRKEVKESNYVGEVKKRMTFENVKCVFVKFIDSYYGTSTMIKFVDGDGNNIVWFGSGSIETYTQGETYNIVGTVKKHEEYNGVKQTMINRVKLA